MTRAQQIYLETIDAAGHDFNGAADCLRDGQYLSAAEYTDDDQSDIEIVYSAFTDSTDLLDIFTEKGESVCEGVTVNQDYEKETTTLNFDVDGYDRFMIIINNKDISIKIIN